MNGTPAGSAFTFKEKYLILCEGKHDCAFFNALIEARSLPSYQTTEPSELTGTGGHTQWKNALAQLVGTTGFDMLKGLIMVPDNDENPRAAIKRVKDAIRVAPK